MPFGSAHAQGEVIPIAPFLKLKENSAVNSIGKLIGTYELRRRDVYFQDADGSEQIEDSLNMRRYIRIRAIDNSFKSLPRLFAFDGRPLQDVRLIVDSVDRAATGTALSILKIIDFDLSQVQLADGDDSHPIPNEAQFDGHPVATDAKPEVRTAQKVIVDPSKGKIIFLNTQFTLGSKGPTRKIFWTTELTITPSGQISHRYSWYKEEWVSRGLLNPLTKGHWERTEGINKLTVLNGEFFSKSVDLKTVADAFSVEIPENIPLDFAGEVFKELPLMPPLFDSEMTLSDYFQQINHQALLELQEIPREDRQNVNQLLHDFVVRFSRNLTVQSMQDLGFRSENLNVLDDNESVLGRWTSEGLGSVLSKLPQLRWIAGRAAKFQILFDVHLGTNTEFLNSLLVSEAMLTAARLQLAANHLHSGGSKQDRYYHEQLIQSVYHLSVIATVYYERRYFEQIAEITHAILKAIHQSAPGGLSEVIADLSLHKTTHHVSFKNTQRFEAAISNFFENEPQLTCQDLFPED